MRRTPPIPSPLYGPPAFPPGYAPPDRAKVIAGVEGKLSGLTYDALQKRLLAISNKPTALHALSIDGQLLATYKRFNREWVPLSRIAPSVPKALIAKFSEAIRRGLWTPRSNSAYALLEETT